MEYVNNNTHHHFYIQTAQYITPNITANTIPINYIVGCLSCPSQLVMKALAQTKFCTEMSSITSRHKEIQNLTNQTNTLSYSHTMTMHSARWHWLYSSEAVTAVRIHCTLCQARWQKVYEWVSATCVWFRSVQCGTLCINCTTSECVQLYKCKKIQGFTNFTYLHGFPTDPCMLL